MNERIERPGDQLVQRIVDLVRRKGIGEGERIPGETDLSAELGVSRPAVREALMSLEAVGMLVSRKGSGRVLQRMDFGAVLQKVATLAPLDDRRMLELLSIRQLLEVGFLAESISRMTPQSLDALGRVTAEIEAKAARGDYFAEEDQTFHLLLHSGLENAVLNGILSLFWTSYRRIDPERMSHSQRLDETAAHHRRIHDAIRAGDVRRAQHHLDRHFYDTAYVIANTPGGGEPDG
ncbi:DNA-binding transcriptional regulator, FadR family [Devosia enhydra]|uniref:DNA-binding transcriptional regulator, FadR family n=1 Tax=Devosia enhydra TaxID=665118 RepID=A0A1K2HS65_9HYPH|nr:FCD domain-containing protein [Devosia enhydra]SFZ80692.1 DNA-binding transcriptional regulator, FadR family [Devosia enhydra]